ncbi:MAG: 50S ribosomal protein L11 methyltransferase [Cocleimonas sp.]
MSSHKTWLQCVCSASKKHHEKIEAEMDSAGALSITWQDAEDNPVLEPLPGETPLWESLIITALFDSDTDLSYLTKQLNSNISTWEIQDFHTEVLQDQDWERVWMKDFHPMCFGKNLWIIPSNTPDSEVEEIQKKGKPTTILLDPGLAFGTGTHPTTALCLEWLDENPPKGLTVVDYGCGSGILAVAAAKLEATSIIATDIDPQALTATKDNMLRNQITLDKILCFLPEDCPKTPVDLVLANILCGPLLELFHQLNALVNTGGKIVISGLLETQKQSIIDTYSTHFTNFDVKQQGDWIRISATKV